MRKEEFVMTINSSIGASYRKIIDPFINVINAIEETNEKITSVVKKTLSDHLQPENVKKQKISIENLEEIECEEEKLNKGIIRYPDGGVYKGFFNDSRKPYGQGILTLKDGTEYEGLFEKGKLEKGLIKYPNGILYEGDISSSSWKPYGQGILTLKDGTKYEGFFKNSKLKEAIIRYPSGMVYEGSINSSGAPHGKGVLTLKEGVRYEGLLDEKEGLKEGVINFPTGVYHNYKGGVKNGLRHGIGEYRDSYGSQISGVWFQNHIVLDHSYLGHPIFLRSLLNKEPFISALSSLYIFHSYYVNKKLYPELVSIFESTFKIYHSPQEESTEEIFQDLNRKKQTRSRLLLFSTRVHSMLLEITPRSSSIIFKIYNSGDGLEYHKSKILHDLSGRYQTMLQIEVPKESVNRAVIKDLLTTFYPEVKEAYAFLLTLPGAKILSQEAPIWQKPQGGFNCTLKCVLVFLRHKLGEEKYNKMKMNLLLACYEAVGSSTDESVRILLPLVMKKYFKQRRKFRSS